LVGAFSGPERRTQDETPQYRRALDPQALQRTYRDLTVRMNGLAHKLADPGS